MKKSTTKSFHEMLIGNRAKSCNFKNLRIICMKQYENSLAHLYGNKLVQSRCVGMGFEILFDSLVTKAKYLLINFIILQNFTQQIQNKNILQILHF